MSASPEPAQPAESKAAQAARNADYTQLDFDKLTPMMRHYIELKEQYPHALLLYRVGDFFEAFFTDAITVARELELVLTSKEGGKAIGRVPMTGVPHHALERYSRLLVERGYAIVVCDQVEDAAQAAAENRMVARQVTRLLTPGTVMEDEMLSARRNNFLAAVVLAGEHWGLAYADISTGEFLTTQSRDREALQLELQRLQPAEVLVPTDAPDWHGLLRPGERSQALPDCLPEAFCYTPRPQAPFEQAEARQRLLQQFQLRSLEGMGCERLPLGVRAAGGLLEYLESTQKAHRVPLQPIRSYALAEYLILDAQSRRNLEIAQTARDGTFAGSLLWALDRCRTAMGSRTLRRWLLQPLLDIPSIQARQDTIQELADGNALREDLQQQLRQLSDLERLTGRAGAGTANARELAGLAESLVRLQALSSLAAQGSSPYLHALHALPPELEQLGQRILDHLVDSPPQQVREGGLIREGVRDELDRRRAAVRDDQNWIANLEASERERTGIANLKVGYNKTFGYYIGLPRSKAAHAPADYERKQTLTNEERYVTAELKTREARILNAREELDRLEYEIFAELRAEVGQHAQTIRDVAQAVAALDVLAGLAEVAVHQGYCRPQMSAERPLEIADGRHPVVEQSLPAGFFVPNGTALGSEQAPDAIILTGPNASGKSCYLRQVGLIQLMAQTGSFVPASQARLGICDRIFTRVGAVDDLTTGQSTFMVEMNETANILNHATARSLVLLDEIGRGTATFDGLSIAWSVAEYLATELRARTLFATHYHELNELANWLPNVANYRVTVKELPDRIVFLHQVQPGGADRSYGIEAGRLAGLPGPVIERAQQVMHQIEKHSRIALGLRKSLGAQTGSAASCNGDGQQLDIFGGDGMP